MKNVKHLFAGFVVGIVLAIAPSCGTTKACSSVTCSTGCCDAKGECQPGTSNGACGQLGGTCQVCQIAQACSLGTCAQTNGNGGGSGNGGGGGTTGGGGGTTGGGGGTTGGGGGTTGGGGGTTGGGGGTTGGGGGTTGGGGGTCDGCFFQGSCIIRANSNNNTLCGQGGVQCATCTGTQTCQNYVCVTGGTGGGGTTGGGGGTTGGGGGTTLQPIGGACTSSTNCQAGLTCRFTTQRGDATYPGGYCTKACSTTTDCGGGGNDCIGGAQSSLQFYGEPNGFCAAACASAGSQSNCRSGYLCEFAATGSPGLCWLNPIPPFNGGTPATNTGIACTSDSCQPAGTSALLSFCFPPTLSDGGFSGWTQGYCSADCGFDNTGTFCGSGATCVTLGTPPNDSDVCLARCSAPGTRSTCRSGYSCYGLRNPDGGTSVNSICYPDCTVTGCSTGGTCSTTTGQCM